MGQRHQFFLIARVKDRYQCVAVFHSQMLFGRLVVNTAARLIRAFVNPINAAAIASELATLDELDSTAIVDRDHDDHENPAILCPYLTGLFMTCSRVNTEYRRIYEMSILSVSSAPYSFLNDDGYTFFDLTVQGRPRYCFWWPRTAPLTAFQYLSYYLIEKNLPIDIDNFALLGHCVLLDVSTLAAVWPREFAEQLPVIPSSLPPYPLARSAMSAFGGIRATKPSLRTAFVALCGLICAMHIDASFVEFLRLRDTSSSDTASVPGPPGETETSGHPSLAPQSAESAASAIVEKRLSTKQELDAGAIHPEVARRALLAVNRLNYRGVALLKQLLLAEKAAFVDLKPWLSTGALHASMLLGMADALVHAEYLDLSFSSTLTAEIVEALVPRLPNLRHLVAFSCTSLGPLTTVLPLTTYLASLPVHDAVDQSRFKDDDSTSGPECVRWVEESDPPAGLSVVLLCPSLAPVCSIFCKPRTQRRYGVELAHFGAEGVVFGFTRFLERLYDPDYSDSENGCYFEMRAYFHATGSVRLVKCLPGCLDPAGSRSYGCMPSLIRDFEPEDGRAFPSMESTTASGGITNVPRHPGWVLAFDTKGTMPYHTNPPKLRCPLEAKMELYKHIASSVVAHLHADARANGRPVSREMSMEDFMKVSPDFFADPPPPPPLPAHVRPEYAFERWDVRPGGTMKELQPVERLSVREWVARLPRGHGTVPEDLLAYCERVLTKLKVVLRGSSPESASSM